MSRLTIRLFGPPQISLDDQQLDFQHHKPVALLAYLAVTEQYHARDVLATMLWPEYNQARAYLRNNLSIIRKALGPGYRDWIHIDRDTIGLQSHAPIWVDVTEFQQKVDATHGHNCRSANVKQGNAGGNDCQYCGQLLAEAAALYQDDFLAGFTLRDSPSFDEWQFFQREKLLRKLTTGLDKLVQHYLTRNHLQPAIDVVRQWLTTDPAHEPAHRQLMRLYAWSNQRSAAIRQYEECKRILAAEMKVRPDERTRLLLKSIQNNELAPPSALKNDSAGQMEQLPASKRKNQLRIGQERLAAPYELQHQPTSLVGRTHACRQIHKIIDREDVRLLTLTGAAGVGKTRLALEVVAELMHRFVDGIYFVSLAPVRDAQQVMSTVAQTLGIHGRINQTLVETVKNALHDRKLLLLLDNFEHIVAAAPDVAQLLQTCPNLKLLVTSRQPLHVRGEHEFEVVPLDIPDRMKGSSIDTLLRNDSVQLFLQRAQAIRSDFELTSENASAIVSMCTRLDGLPLAIELAVPHIKLFSPQALSSQLDKGPALNLLRAGSRDMPDRHQTLRRALTWSIDTLEPETQALFRKLAIFVGHFTLEAAEAVCGDGFEAEFVIERAIHTSRYGSTSSEFEEIKQAHASASEFSFAVLDGIRTLVDNSLLRQDERRDGESSYMMLETIREYGLELLRESNQFKELQRQHAAYYLSLAIDKQTELESPVRALWFDQLLNEEHNLRAALDWAIHNEHIEIAMRLGMSLGLYWQKTGYNHEADNLISQMTILSQTAQPSMALAEFLFYLGIKSDLHTRPANREELYRKSLKISQQVGHKQQAAYALSLLCDAAFRRGNYNKANAYRDRAHDLYLEIGDEWGYYFGLGHWGRELAQLGQFEEARTYSEEGLTKVRLMGHKWGIAVTLRNCADVALLQGRLDQAELFLQEQLDLCHEMANENLIASAKHAMSRVALQRGDTIYALQLLQESLSYLYGTTQEEHLLPGLEIYAALAVARHQPAEALKFASMIAKEHKSIDIVLPYMLQKQFDEIVASAEGQLSAEETATAWDAGQVMSVDEAVAIVLPEEEVKAFVC